MFCWCFLCLSVFLPPDKFVRWLQERVLLLGLHLQRSHHHHPINMIVFYLLQWSLESRWQRHCVQAELTTSRLLIFGIWFFPCHNYHLILILIISEVGLADLGVYVCKADNKLGVQEAAVFLHGEHQQHHIHINIHCLGTNSKEDPYSLWGETCSKNGRCVWLETKIKVFNVAKIPH